MYHVDFFRFNRIVWKRSLFSRPISLSREYSSRTNHMNIIEYATFRCSLQCQINMNLVFHISEDGSEIELRHCASSKTSVKSSRKYFVHLNLKF